ncbi:DUF461 domain-containing protein [Streptomyces sp. NPDC087850]|uniref:DUF461 domain-containing protein n=1 Tax=Streptomyces sp. NPDC087850 TaxID=3365809 RepID=UPI003819EB8C
MSRSLRRGALAATALVFSLAPLTACGAGNDAQTLGVKPDNAATSVGDISIQNATVITRPEADASGPAVVTGTVFNSGRTDQTLDSIKLPGTGATVRLTPAKGSGPITVPAQGSIQLGGKDNASAVIDKGDETAKNGDAQQIVFSFSETGDVGLRAFVFPSRGYYEGVGPSTPPVQSPAAKKPAASESPAAGAGQPHTQDGAPVGDAAAGTGSVDAGSAGTGSVDAAH